MKHYGIGDFIHTASNVVFLEQRQCPKHCGKVITGKDAQKHFAEECPNRQIHCPHGCGELVFGYQADDVTQHPAVCTMKSALETVQAALDEELVKEYRIAMDAVYLERDRARARLKAQGEKDPGPIFLTKACQIEVRRLEAEGHNLLTRARRQAKEKLVGIIGTACLGPGDGTAASQVPPGAARYWDTMEWSKEFTRSARPWDFAAPILHQLLQILEDARICGAETALRRKAESLLFMALIRSLEAALASAVNRGELLKDALDIADAALKVCELQDTTEVMLIYRKAEKEVFRSALRDVPTTCKQFHDAVREGDVDLTTWLLDTEQANPLELDPDRGLPPLVQAAKAGDMAMCELLLDRGADIDAKCSTDGTTALHWACHFRTFRIVKLLLSKGSNPRLQDKRGHDALVKLLRRDFQSPADTCASTWHLQRSQCLAGPELSSGEMSTEDAKILAENTSDCVGFSVHGVFGDLPDLPTSTTDSESTYFIRLHGPGRSEAALAAAKAARAAERAAARKAKATQRWKAAKAAAAVQAAQDAAAAAAAAAAESEKNGENGEEAPAGATPEELPPPPPVVKAPPVPSPEPAKPAPEPDDEEEEEEDDEDLLWTHPDPAWTSFVKVKTDPIHDVHALLAATADPTTEDLEGLTALHHHLLSSPSRGTLSCVEALLRGGANVNHRDHGHRCTTPFIIAVQSKRTDLVKAMMEHAWPVVDVDSKAPDGTCALALAQSLGAKEIAELLRKAGASEWADAELRLGTRTIFTYDTRKPPVNN